MTVTDALAKGWYDAEDGTRRYWDGLEWFIPAEGGDGAPRIARRPPRRRLLVAAVLAAVLLLCGAGVAGKLVLDARATATAAAQHRAAQAQAAVRLAAARERSRQAAEAAERSARAALVADLEHSVKKTAKQDVTEGVLDGPIRSVSCTPLGGGSTDYLTARSATFECFAANAVHADGSKTGYRFSATMNWTTGEYTWHLGT